MIDQTLKAWRQSRFAYGQTDCLMSLGAYAAAAGGADVGKGWRGLYHTQEKAKAIMAAYGGPQGLIDLAGFPRCPPEDARRGDMVVIRLKDGDLIGGLCTGPGIAVRGERGVIELSRRLVDVVFAWRVAPCQS